MNKKTEDPPSLSPEDPPSLSPEAPNISLDVLRQSIDQVDQQILSLLNERSKLNQLVFKAKKGQTPYRPEREQQILSNLSAQNKSLLSSEQIQCIFTEIISACRSLQKKIKVLFLGPKGTFTYEAALKQFGHCVELIEQKTIQDIFESAEKKDLYDYAVVPIENSLEGRVHDTLEALVHSNLYICAEIEIPIAHHLITHAKKYSDIQTVISHPQALLQCKKWLRNKLPHALQKASPSTASAVEQATSKNPSIAAVGSALASEVFKSPIFMQHIEDDPKNTTRFVLLGHQVPEPSGQDKTSFFMQLDDTPGALHRVLACFNDLKINMKKIESYPSKREKWTYVFFIDVDGHIQNKPLRQALKELKPITIQLKILGSYPKHPH